MILYVINSANTVRIVLQIKATAERNHYIETLVNFIAYICY